MFDIDGSTSIDGFVRLVSKANTSDADPNNDIRFEVESPVTAGSSIILPAISGRTFQVTAGPAAQSDTKLPPSPVFITPSEGENVVVNLSMVATNYKLTVTPQPLTSDDTALDPSTFERIGCFAYNARQQRRYSEDLSNGSILLNLRVQKKKVREYWRVGCYGVPLVSENSTKYFGEVDFLTRKGGKPGDVTVSMSPTGTSYSETVEVVPVDEESEILFADSETTLAISEGAFGTSGEVEFSIKSGHGWRADSESIPLQAWDIKPTVDGSIVNTPNEPLEFCMPVSSEDLNNFGVSEAAAQIASYDFDQERWIPEETIFVGSEGNRFACASLEHFSIWGLILDVLSELKESVPTEWKVKLKKAKGSRQQCLYTWTAPITSYDEVIPYLVRFSKKGSRADCDNIETAELLEKVVYGATKTTVPTKKACCGEVLVQDGDRATEREYKKVKKKKKK